MGLIIHDEFIALPLLEEESLPVAKEDQSYVGPLEIVKQNKAKKILLIILAVIMILIIIPAFFYGGLFFLFGIGYGAGLEIFVGLIIVIGGLASCIFGIIILIKQWSR